MKPIKYPTAESVLEAIVRRWERGLPVNYGAIFFEDQALLTAARRHFGGWRSALEAVGIEYDEVRRNNRGNPTGRRYKYRTAADVVSEIIRRHDQHRPLNTMTVLREDQALLDAARRLFGSWRAAVEAAGLDYDTVSLRRPRGYWSRERVLALARERLAAGKNMRPRRVEIDDPPLYAAALKHWRGWKSVLRALNADTPESDE